MKSFVPATVGFVLIVGILFGMIFIFNGLDDVESENNWNEGKCKICNNQWELYQITSQKGTRYFYIDSKGHMFESSLYFNDKENK